tara:strand:- start:795 stop:1181 length:387 start_codon:yes stop_codon:yes gene_type:complete
MGTHKKTDHFTLHLLGEIDRREQLMCDLVEEWTSVSLFRYFTHRYYRKEYLRQLRIYNDLVTDYDNRRAALSANLLETHYIPEVDRTGVDNLSHALGLPGVSLRAIIHSLLMLSALLFICYEYWSYIG